MLLRAAARRHAGRGSLQGSSVVARENVKALSDFAAAEEDGPSPPYGKWKGLLEQVEREVTRAEPRSARLNIRCLQIIGKLYSKSLRRNHRAEVDAVFAAGTVQLCSLFGDPAAPLGVQLADVIVAVHAFAKVAYDAPDVFSAAERVFVAKGLTQRSVQDLAMLVWACARVRHDSHALADTVAAAAIPQLPQASPKWAGALAAAFGDLGGHRPALFDAVSARVLETLRHCEAPTIGLVTRVLASQDHHHRHKKFFPAVAAELRARRLVSVPAHVLTTVIAAFASVRYKDREFFDAVVGTLRRTGAGKRHHWQTVSDAFKAHGWEMEKHVHPKKQIKEIYMERVKKTTRGSSTDALNSPVHVDNLNSLSAVAADRHKASKDPKSVAAVLQKQPTDDGVHERDKAERVRAFQSLQKREGEDSHDHFLADKLKAHLGGRPTSVQVQTLPRFIHDQRAAGHCPGRITYSVALKACAATGSMAIATDLFGVMMSDGVQPDVRIYNHLLVLCSKLRRTRQLELYYEDMIARGISGNAITYTELLRGVGRSAPAETERVWNAMLKAGVVPDQVLWALFIRVAPTLRTATARLEDALRSTAVKGTEEKVRCLGAAIAVAGRMQHVEAAERLFVRIHQDYGRDAGVEQWTALMKGYAEGGDVNGAVAVLTRMTAAGVSPSHITYVTLLNAAMKASPVQVDMAEETFARALAGPLKPLEQELLWNTMASVYAATGPRMKEKYARLLASMKRQRLRINRGLHPGERAKLKQ
eukprot:TRINITY_DN29971_c0_g1_i1.p1 TRINITY_DN29971_c0_g1~~TRINITY_DN29971_c0_g1_i1.p1  ORF type:complete len:760 (+),score=100.91 TRINITY_DN29971_c0_g1_i1:1079-3358(+)